MSGQYIQYRNDPRVTKIQLTGAKAARLGMLHAQGFPVPDFFVLSTATFKKFSTRRNKISNTILEKLVTEGLDYFNRPTDSPLNLAVRSSAPFEDHASFSLAGQFKSFLNIKGKASLLDAIYQCWDSMQTANVQAYMRQFNFTFKNAAMGVIVQKMLNPEFAGVLFTRHPVTGDDKVLLIEIVSGVGESLVSGEREPVRILVQRDDPASSKIYGGEDDIRYLHNSNNFEPFIQNLVKQALAIEKLFGAPQDIEWACEGGQLWILQSRPITHTVSRERTKVDSQGNIWTDYFFAERFVEPLSPLGWSILQKWVVKNAFREPLFFLGRNRLARQKDLTKLIDGYPFTRITVFQQLYAPIPLRFISNDKQTSLLLQNRQSKWWWELVKVAPSFIRLLLIKDFNWFPEVNLRAWNKFVKFNKQSLESLKLKLTDSTEALTVFRETEQLTDVFLCLHRWSITFADIFFVVLQKFLYLLKPVADCDKLLSELVSGLANDTVKANMELLNIDKSESAIQEFLHKYGHRSESLDIIHPCWVDDPDMIKTLAEKIDITKAEAARREFMERVLVRQQAEKACCKKIAGYIPVYREFVRWLFSMVLNYTQQFTLLRENQRSEWHKILSVMRHAVLVYGNLLVQRGVLHSSTDVFYLSRLELYVSDKFTPEFNSIIQNRISIRELHSIKDDLVHRNNIPSQDSGLKGSGRLEGFGVSKGIIRGRAHVARSFREARQANGDDILVAHSADPAWSPIFSMISGMVLETGGILSHASIVAREFGLPTVTGVARATDVIQTGDWLEIDGESGIVQILTQNSEKS